jgi:hypothetical protein
MADRACSRLVTESSGYGHQGVKTRTTGLSTLNLNLNQKEKDMFARISTVLPVLLVTAVTGLLLTQVATGSENGHGWTRGNGFIEVNATDDLLPGPPTGEVYCSQGDIDMTNPLMPVCPEGASLEVRNVAGMSRMYSDDPRMSGLLTYVSNASFDAGYFTGPVWGSWQLEVEACDGFWEGTWSGDRTFVPGQWNPVDAFFPPGFGGVWISKVELRGQAEGACIDRLRMKGIEIIITLTPMPVPYEVLGPLCAAAGCLPEGVITSKILGPWQD